MPTTPKSNLHVQINYYFDLDGTVEGFAKLRSFIASLEDAGIGVSVDTVGVSENPPPAVSLPAPTTPARRRGRPRDKDKAAADKANGEADALDLVDTEPVAGDDELVEEDDADALGLSPLTEPSSAKSGAEAKEDAMVIVRAAWAVEDKPKHFPHRAAVKQLQTKLGVASFRDVADQDGHKFYKLALELAEDRGLRA